MKSFYKVCIRVALGIIGLGIILTIIGITSGATWNSLRVGPIRIGNRIDSDINTVINTEDKNTEALNKTYKNVKAIDIDIHYGELFIKQGDNFKIEASNKKNNNLKSYMDGNTWMIKDSSRMNFSFFGIQIGDNGLDFENDKTSVTIYIPKGFNADRLSINLGAGTIDIDQLSGDKVSLDVGAGELYVKSLIAYEEAEFSVGAGEIEIDKIEASNTKIECGIGEITFDGVLKGDSSVECGVGDVDLNLNGNEEDYNYYIESGVGNVIINDDKYSFTSSTKKVNDNANGDFNINCGVGNVTIIID